jgi:hypothetical protein
MVSYKPVPIDLCLSSKTFSLNVTFCTTAHLPPKNAELHAFVQTLAALMKLRCRNGRVADIASTGAVRPSLRFLTPTILTLGHHVKKSPSTDAVMQYLRQTLWYRVEFTKMKIERHGQAKILTQQEIELLFNKGLQTSRDRTLFGVCLYTACRIAEACSLMVKDIYTELWHSPFYNQLPQSQHQRKTPNQDDSGD